MPLDGGGSRFAPIFSVFLHLTSFFHDSLTFIQGFTKTVRIGRPLFPPSASPRRILHSFPPQKMKAPEVQAAVKWGAKSFNVQVDPNEPLEVFQAQL